MSVVTRNCR